MSHHDDPSASVMARFAGSVELKFQHPMIEGQYKLLEVTDAMLAQIQASQFDPITRTQTNLIELRGAQTDEAALVTKDKTYSVRLVECSNTQLLVDATPSSMFTPSAGKTARSSTSDEDANPSPHKKQKLGESKEQDPTDAAASGEIDLPTRTIEGTVQHHYEVTEILPRLHVLRDLLTKRLYNEEAEEETTTAGEEQHQQEEESKETDDVDMTKDPASSPSAASCTAKSTPLYTFSSLRRLVQASDVELQRGLADLDAFEDSRGYWRILDPDYTAKVFDSLVTLFVEKQWTSVERIDVRECEEGLQELYPKVVTRQVLRMHSTPATPAGGGAVDPNMVSLSAQKVALLQALQLFARLQPYPHVQFLADWQARMPEGMKVDVTWLRGHALCDVSAQLEAFSRAASVVTGAVKPSEESLLTWRYFPVSSLSPLSKTRFAQLFDARAKWRLGEIEPYVAGLCTPGQTIEQLLLKMTRPISVVENGSKVVVYTRKN